MAKYGTNEFLENLYKEVQPKLNLKNCELSEVEAIRKEEVRKLKAILKLDELEQLVGCEPTFELEDNLESMGIQVDKYKLSAIKGLDFPVYHLKPNNPNGKAILFLHGHDDLGVMGAIMERYDKVRYHKMIPAKLAKEGYEVFAPEEIGLGEASFSDFPRGSEKVAGCVPNAHYLTLAGFSIAGFRAYQSVKTLDMMEQFGIKDDITVFGISGGGMTAQHMFAMDERINYGMITCYPNTYYNSILAKEHCICNYIPGILTVGDSAALLSLGAPKKLLAANGIWDKGFPQAGSEKAFEYLQDVYERLGVSENFEGKLIENGHAIDEDLVIDWLKRNVK